MASPSSMTMLSSSSRLASRLANPAKLSQHVRLYSETQTPVSSDKAGYPRSHSSGTRPLPKYAGPRRGTTPQSNVKSVFVSTGRPITSMQEGLFVLTALEKKFGPAREFKFPRDGDTNNEFVNYFVVDFIDPSVHARLAEHGDVVHVEVPDAVASAPSITDGGSGLESIQPYLLPTVKAREADTSDSTGDNVVSRRRKPNSLEVRLEAANRPFTYVPRQRAGMDSARNRAVGAELLRWGGFAPRTPKPENPEQSTTPRMDAVYDRWRNLLNREEYEQLASNRHASAIVDMPPTVLESLGEAQLPFEQTPLSQKIDGIHVEATPLETPIVPRLQPLRKLRFQAETPTESDAPKEDLIAKHATATHLADATQSETESTLTTTSTTTAPPTSANVSTPEGLDSQLATQSTASLAGASKRALKFVSNRGKAKPPVKLITSAPLKSVISIPKTASPAQVTTPVATTSSTQPEESHKKEGVVSKFREFFGV